MARKASTRKKPQEAKPDPEQAQPEQAVAQAPEPVKEPEPEPEMVGRVQIGGIYQVIEGRRLFFTNEDRQTTWAMGGQYVIPDHPVLAEMVNDQFAQVNKVDAIPEGGIAIPIDRASVLALMAKRKWNASDSPLVRKVLEEELAGAPEKPRLAPEID